MIMKQFLLSILLLCTSFVWAQAQSTDADRITIHAYVPPYEYITQEASQLLETKLQEIIANNGVADNDGVNRFILTFKINVLSKDIVATTPQRVSQKLGITLMIGDVIEDKVYATKTINAIGIGTSLEKSYIAAVKNIKPQNKDITEFMQLGKSKIIAYYEAHAEEILAEANALAGQENYDDALSLLSSVPDVCRNTYSACSELAATLYEKKINADGNYYYQQAKTAWANSPNREGAEQATAYLSKINFAAQCQPQAERLAEEITAKMNVVDKREWAFSMQQYKDNIEREKREWSLRVKQEENNHERNMALDAQRYATQRTIIKACRDIAVERAKHQPRVINFNRIILW